MVWQGLNISGVVAIGAVDRHIFSVLYVCESFLCDNIGSDHVCKVSGCFFLRQ